MNDHDCSNNVSIVVQNKIVSGCDLCIEDTLQQGHEGAARFEREFQRKQYRKDIVQPNQPREYLKAYGVDKAREAGFREDQIRRYS